MKFRFKTRWIDFTHGELLKSESSAKLFQEIFELLRTATRSCWLICPIHPQETHARRHTPKVAAVKLTDIPNSN